MPEMPRRAPISLISGSGSNDPVRMRFRLVLAILAVLAVAGSAEAFVIIGRDPACVYTPTKTPDYGLTPALHAGGGGVGVMVGPGASCVYGGPASPSAMQGEADAVAGAVDGFVNPQQSEQAGEGSDSEP